jgi:hypothetical protein
MNKISFPKSIHCRVILFSTHGRITQDGKIWVALFYRHGDGKIMETPVAVFF